MEGKEQLQDILKSMENLLNQGPGPSRVFPRSSSSMQRLTCNGRLNVETYAAARKILKSKLTNKFFQIFPNKPLCK